MRKLTAKRAVRLSPPNKSSHRDDDVKDANGETLKAEMRLSPAGTITVVNHSPDRLTYTA
jgi:hypothetical protein